MKKTSDLYKILLSESIKIITEEGEESVEEDDGIKILCKSLGFTKNDDGTFTAIEIKRKTYECPKCHKHNAFYREVGSDTDYNTIELYCPDCHYSEEK